MSIVVVATDRISESGLGPLLEDDRFLVHRIDDSTSSEFENAFQEARGLIVRSATRVTPEMMDMATALEGIGRAGVGVDNIDIGAATQRGIAVFNAPTGNSNAAVELTMALLLSLARRVSAADRSVREGHWDRSRFQGVELRGRTLGLIGAGNIGGEVARLSQAFGMKVLVYDPYLSDERAAALGVALVDLGWVLETADVISLHVPLTEETRGLIDASAIEKMKKTCFLLNASRGGVVDEDAIAAALHDGRIAGAALDVYESEPLPLESPLRLAPNLVLTPHLGASTDEAQIGVAFEVSEKLKRMLTDGDRSTAINGAELT
ncbi:MAG: hydroxyacid dehydrogenase [Acidimicrobiia bacterium]